MARMVRKPYVIYLISKRYVTNPIGDSIEKTSKRRIKAAETRLYQNELTQAAATGLRFDIAFTVNTAEYKGEPALLYNGTEYNIMQTEKLNHREIKLRCQGLVNNAFA